MNLTKNDLEQTMSKTFYTEKDIDELFKQGIRSLKMTDQVALTDLAYERAHRLGIQLDQGYADTPPAAPVRPYLSQPAPPRASTPAPRSPTSSGRADLQARIREAVMTRLGNQIDPKLLDSIIQRVLKTTGLK
jgi:hypothetical protein